MKLILNAAQIKFLKSEAAKEIELFEHRLLQNWDHFRFADWKHIFFVLDDDDDVGPTDAAAWSE